MFKKEEKYFILAGFFILLIYLLNYGNINGLSISSNENLPNIGFLIKEYQTSIHKEGKFFDVDLLIPEKYSELFAGEELTTEITITNLKRIGLVDVNIEYYIEDINKNIVYKEIETKAVENVKTYVKQIEIPTDISPGNYMLYVQVTYKNDVSIIGRPITIIKKPFILKGYYIVIALILIIFIISILYEYIRFRKIENLIKKVNERNLKEHILIRRGD